MITLAGDPGSDYDRAPMGMRLLTALLVPLAMGLVASGCGAAYYGTALGIIASQEDEKTVDISFPDAVLTDLATPAFGTMTLGPEVTVQRTTANGGISDVTGFEVTNVAFPTGYGELLSNRDAGQSLGASDRLVVRIDGDPPQALTFDATDVSSVGSAVAAAIQKRVRLLQPGGSAPAESYSRFTASFDTTTLSYRFRSGAPGPASAVAFEVAVPGASVQPDAASAATALRLGLGQPNGDIASHGDDGFQVTVLNRGTDVIGSGTPIELWLSHDKLLDEQLDLPLGSFPLDAPVAVGEARRFSARGRTPPSRRLVRQDFTPGRWFLILRIAASGGEQIQAGNVLVSPAPLEVYGPVDDPATAAVETALDLDFAFVRTGSPIAVVTSGDLVSRLTVANYGAPVPMGGRQLDLDVILSADQSLDEPAAFLDPAAALAGLIVNPTDPARPITVRLQAGSGPGAVVGVAADVLTVSFDPATTVAAAIAALNAVPGGLVDAFSDGRGNPATDTLTALIAAAQKNEGLARDVLMGRQRVTFPQVDRPIVPQPFVVTFPVRSPGYKAAVLPVKLFPFYRLRLVPLPGDAAGENTRNDARQGANFVRVYDRTTAFFDPITGATLPTKSADDFARLDAVTLRPVNTGSLRQGQQRVFSFELPTTGLALDESQLLVILRTTNFDAHLDLLSSNGQFLAGSDDSPLGSSPLVYTPVQGSGQNNRTLYLVVGTALADESDLSGGGEAFELTISVNARQPGDLGPVSAVDAQNVLSRVPQRYADAAAPRTVNDVLIPFSLATAQAELMFVLPERARVRFRTTPVFTVGTSTVITRFLEGAVPSPVEHQAVLENPFNRIVYRPSGGGTDNAHLLERGVYTFAFEGLNQLPDTQKLRLEVETEFVPD